MLTFPVPVNITRGIFRSFLPYSGLILFSDFVIKMTRPYQRVSNVVCLFDLDGTLTKPRHKITEDMVVILDQLKKRVSVGVVSGSDIAKLKEQLGDSEGIKRFDYVFPENGLVAYRNGEFFSKESILKYMGEEKLQQFINYCLKYMSGLTLPAKRGNFIEFRDSVINVCPVGRSCSQVEREEFNQYDKYFKVADDVHKTSADDVHKTSSMFLLLKNNKKKTSKAKEHKIREKFVEILKKEFEHSGLRFSIGGQISFDVFPEGWDKRFCLKHVINDGFKEIHFFGDKTEEGGNDYEIFKDPRTIGHTVTSPEDTKDQLTKLFLS